MIPVYEMLSNSSSDKELEIEQKELFLKNIKNMDSMGHELIYVIIKSHEMNGDSKQTLYPFGGKVQKSGIKFEMDSFDNKLQQILFKFSEMHIQTQNER